MTSCCGDNIFFYHAWSLTLFPENLQHYCSHYSHAALQWKYLPKSRVQSDTFLWLNKLRHAGTGTERDVQTYLDERFIQLLCELSTTC